jgi:hypothetical protein
LPLARLFDRLDVRLRRLGRAIKSLWTGLPAIIRSLVILTFVAVVGYVAYYLFFGG